MNGLIISMEDQIKINDKKILLVEDNSNDALLTQRSLKKANILNKVVWVKDGAEAIEYLFINCLEQGEKLPQLILLDIHMPKVNGIETLQRIRSDERLSWLPVIIFTSSKEEKDLLESYRLGINSYVCKPINFEAFAAAVAAIGCYWLLINQAAEKSAVSRLSP
jgi:CheY-like chemotaxis protein